MEWVNEWHQWGNGCMDRCKQLFSNCSMETHGDIMNCHDFLQLMAFIFSQNIKLFEN